MGRRVALAALLLVILPASPYIAWFSDRGNNPDICYRFFDR